MAQQCVVHGWTLLTSPAIKRPGDDKPQGMLSALLLLQYGFVDYEKHSVERCSRHSKASIEVLWSDLCSLDFFVANRDAQV